MSEVHDTCWWAERSPASSWLSNIRKVCLDPNHKQTKQNEKRIALCSNSKQIYNADHIQMHSYTVPLLMWVFVTINRNTKKGKLNTLRWHVQGISYQTYLNACNTTENQRKQLPSDIHWHCHNTCEVGFSTFTNAQPLEIWRSILETCIYKFQWC